MTTAAPWMIVRVTVRCACKRHRSANVSLCVSERGAIVDREVLDGNICACGVNLALALESEAGNVAHAQRVDNLC